jgi:hypothetical protein
VTPPLTSFTRRASNTLLIALFFALLWIPLAESVLQFDPSPAPNEKRTPAAFPQFTCAASGLRDYLSGLEKYYNDHFGFRKTLLRWEHKWKRSLFRESAVTEAMIGRDGWLYLARGGMVDNMLGNLAYTDAQLAAWRQVFQTRRDWCAARGIAYQLVIAAEKHSVYPEHLPTWIPATRKADQISQLVAYLKTNSTVPVLDLREPLRQAKTNRLTFHVTDTHWNDYGAFIGYTELLNALTPQRPELKPLPLEAFEIRQSQQPGGDLAVMLAQERSLMEADHIALVPRPPLTAIATKADPTISQGAGKKVGPAIFVAENPAGRGTLVMFHDSFAAALQPFLAQHFQRAVYVWQHDWNVPFLEQQKPEVVIDEIAERSFYRGNPASWKNE